MKTLLLSINVLHFVSPWCIVYVGNHSKLLAALQSRVGTLHNTPRRPLRGSECAILSTFCSRKSYAPHIKHLISFCLYKIQRIIVLVKHSIQRITYKYVNVQMLWSIVTYHTPQWSYSGGVMGCAAYIFCAYLSVRLSAITRFLVTKYSCKLSNGQS